MRLLVDLGNSRMKWAWLDDGGLLRDPGAELHRGAADERVTGALIATKSRPVEIVVASVAAPDLTAAIAEQLRQGLEAPVRAVVTGQATGGVRNGYRDPRQLGVDRWLAMVAAYARYQTALCVVDAGTALTVDALTAAGEHLGGFIVPGSPLMQRSLLRGTGRLEASTRVEQRGSDDEFWGRDTESCMRRGAMRSLVALIDSSLAELARLGVGPGLVLTGGDAALIAQRLPSARSHPLLVLEGLAMIIADGLDPPGHAA